MIQPTKPGKYWRRQKGLTHWQECEVFEVEGRDGLWTRMFEGFVPNAIAPATAELFDWMIDNPDGSKTFGIDGLSVKLPANPDPFSPMHYVSGPETEGMG